MHPRACNRILYVEDEPVNRRALSWFLREAGYEVLEAGTGTTALRLAREQHPDLIVLDVNLPDVTGFEICRRLRDDPLTAEVCVLLISAVYVGSEYRSEGLEGGADGYLVKPFEPRELLATARSLLRVRAAEEAARLAAQEWRTTFDAINDGIALVDSDDRILRCNKGLSQQLGRPFTSLLGESFGASLKAAFPLDHAVLDELVAIPDHHIVVEQRLGSRWFRVTTDPIRGADGRITRAVRILTDNTERKELEEQVRQGQKLEAIGRLAGGVAHDFNNLLTAILGNVALLARTLPEGKPEREMVGTIDLAATRAAELTRQLLGFSRKTLLFLAPTSVNNVVREVLSILERTLSPRIHIDLAIEAQLWLVHADPGQLSQVLMNLCLNACDAMPDGGTLRLETANVTLTADDAHANVEVRLGEHVRLRVGDTGQGIPADILPRIFDPFFTTKGVGRGTGLGLAMAFGIVKQHLGWLECRSRVGAGTTFDVYLPRLSAPIRAQIHPAIDGTPAGV